MVPMFWVHIPEALLSDCGTITSSFIIYNYLMQDVCKLLGIRKLNTTTPFPMLQNGRKVQSDSEDNAMGTFFQINFGVI